MSPPRGIPGLPRSDIPRSKSDKQTQKPPKAVFGDLASAHSSITSRSRSGFLKGPTSIKGVPQAARGFPLYEDVSKGNPEIPTAMDQLPARNRSNALAPGEVAPLLLDEIAVKYLSVGDLDSERIQLSTPICGCYLNTSRSNRRIDGEHLDTCPTSRNDAALEAVADNTKQVEDKEFEPIAAGTHTTRVRRTASVSDMGRYAADYPDSMYASHADAPFGFDIAYDSPFRGFATSNHKNANGMLSKSTSYGQYSSETHHGHVLRGLGRADLTEGFREAGGFVGNDLQSVLKSSTAGSIVQEDSSEDTGGNVQDHEANDERERYKMIEDLSQYEAEEDEDVLAEGQDDSQVSSDGTSCISEECIQETSAPAVLAGLENTEPILNDDIPPFNQFALSQFAFSPQTSDDGHSIDDHSGDGHSVGEAETFPALLYQAPGQNTSPTLPSPPPLMPLPASPPLCFQRQATSVARDNSSTTGDYSQSSGSYGHTQNLLGLSSPQRPELQSRAFSTPGCASPVKSSMPASAQPPKSGCEASSMKTSNEPSDQLEGIPPTAAVNTSDRGIARVSILSSDGSIHSLPLSVHEARTLEAEIASHLRRASDISTQGGAGSEFAPPNDHYTCHGRLSIGFRDNDDEVIEYLGPGGSQSSSSHDCLSGSGSYMVNAPRSGRTCRPGFYHDSLISDMRDSSPDPLRGRARDRAGDRATQNHGFGGSLTDAGSAGTTSDAHTREDAQADDDKDWETVGESGSFSRHGTRNAIGRRQTGSSLADYSDSGSLSPPKLAPLFSHRVVQHPPHPRYAPRSFGLLRDKQSGEVVLMPEYTFTDGAGLPNRNALAPFTANRALNNPYQHPTPLSQDHAHPFSSSPPLMPSGRSLPREHGSVHALPSNVRNGLMSQTPSSQKHKEEDMYQAHNLQNSVKVFESSDMPIKDGQRDVSLSTLGHSGIDGSNGSSAWLSTQDGAASVDYGDLPGRGRSFPKITVRGRKANLTDTPDSNPAGKVGSSSAKGTSPSMKLSSSLSHQIANPPYARLAPLEEQPSSTSKLAKSYGRRINDGTVDFTDVAATSDLYDRIRSRAIHRNTDLYDEDEPCDLPPIKIHPLQVLKHRQHLIDHSLLPKKSSSSSAEPRRFPSSLDFPKNQDDPGMEENVPGSTACAAISNTLASLSSSISGTAARMRSPHRRVPSQDDVYEAKKLISYNETAPLSPLMSTPQVGMLSKQQQKSALLDWKEQTMEEGEAHLTHSLNAQAIKPQEGSTLGVKVSKTDGEVSGSQGPIPARPSKPVLPKPRFRPDDRSVSRGESPHLYRIIRPATQALLQRQRELSIMVLCLCFLCPPILIIYGHGFMDGVMEWLTHGQVNAFRPREKMVALVIGYGGSVLCILGVLAGMVTVAMI